MNSNIKTDYISNITETYINPEGIYSILWRKFHQQEITGPISINLARFFGISETYYSIENKIKNQEAKNVIFLIHLSMEITPLNMIKDYLNIFKSSSKLKYFIHFSYDAETTCNNSNFEKYMNSIYQLLVESLGSVPQLLNTEELNKVASFKDWQVVQLGTEWYYSDNFIIHYLLSKGALINSSIELDNVLKVVELSPHHLLKIGLMTKETPSEKYFLDYSIDSLIVHNNSLNIPIDFLRFAYSK